MNSENVFFLSENEKLTNIRLKKIDLFLFYQKCETVHFHFQKLCPSTPKKSLGCCEGCCDGGKVYGNI